jgi:hypothetical protein
MMFDIEKPCSDDLVGTRTVISLQLVRGVLGVQQECDSSR